MLITRAMRAYRYISLVFVLVYLLSGTDSKKKEKVKFQDEGTEISVGYYLYRRSNRNGIYLAKEKIPDDFNRNLPTFVILHGMGSNHDTVCQRNIRNSLLDRRDANVIVPNYTNSSVLYTVLYQEVARKVGNFLMKQRVSQSHTEVVGASLGAQIAGVMRRRSGFKPRDIYALDPAGPVFDQLPDAQRLNSNSADYVQVIHTNAGVFGAVSQLGHDDVYINGGNDYPCCTSNVCRHGGACEFFVRTIRTGPLQARKCDAVGQARSSSCRGPPVEIGYGNSRQGGRRISHLQLQVCGRQLSIEPSSPLLSVDSNYIKD